MASAVCRRCTRTRRVDRRGLCWACRAPERAKVERARRRAEVRTPPLCVDPELAALLDERRAKAQLVELHGEACMACGRAGPVVLDHRRPLWSLTPAERTEFRWFGPFNTWLLCPKDHAAKTRREAGERATARARGMVA
jgi:hypothetical protein